MAARRYTDAQFRAAVADPEIRTMADLCRALGLVPRGGNYESLRAYAAELDIELRQRQHQQPALTHVAHRPRRSYTDEELLDAVERCRNYPELCRALGLRPVSGTYKRLRGRAAELGVPIPEAWSRPGRRDPNGHERVRDPDTDPRPPARLRREYEEAALRDAVARARTRREALRLLGDTPGSVAYQRLERGIQRHGIDASHLTPRAAGGRERRPLDQLLVEDSRANTTRLRQRLIDEGHKDPACEDCGTRRWLEKPVPLELDHINGDRSDNRLTNLRLLCPNCHALTPTYRGRNIGTSSGERRSEAVLSD